MPRSNAKSPGQELYDQPTGAAQSGAEIQVAPSGQVAINAIISPADEQRQVDQPVAANASDHARHDHHPDQDAEHRLVRP